MSAASLPRRLLKTIDRDGFKLLEDETRRDILFLLRERELTVKEIAKELDLTSQNIYHHIRKLTDAGLVKTSKERRRGHLIESYYTVTADTFIYHEDEMEEKPIQSFIDVLNGLNELGVMVDVSEERAKRLSLLHKERLKLLNIPSTVHDICSSCSFSGFFLKYGPLNPILLSRILQYYSLINMDDEEFETSLELTKKLRSYLLKITSK
ncbi:MAG: ArsR/SmtB family transcription factor [Candidatus Bathyarchaeia archaeon]